MTEERRDTVNEPVKENKGPVQEGYQPIEVKKGYQPTVEPNTHVPPQGISALVPVASSTSTPTATPPQATNTPTSAASPSEGKDTATP